MRKRPDGGHIGFSTCIYTLWCRVCCGACLCFAVLLEIEFQFASFPFTTPTSLNKLMDCVEFLAVPLLCERDRGHGVRERHSDSHGQIVSRLLAAAAISSAE